MTGLESHRPDPDLARPPQSPDQPQQTHVNRKRHPQAGGHRPARGGIIVTVMNRENPRVITSTGSTRSCPAPTWTFVSGNHSLQWATRRAGKSPGRPDRCPRPRSLVSARLGSAARTRRRPSRAGRVLRRPVGVQRGPHRVPSHTQPPRDLANSHDRRSVAGLMTGEEDAVTEERPVFVVTGQFDALFPGECQSCRFGECSIAVVMALCTVASRGRRAAGSAAACGCGGPRRWPQRTCCRGRGRGRFPSPRRVRAL